MKPLFTIILVFFSLFLFGQESEETPLDTSGYRLVLKDYTIIASADAFGVNLFSRSERLVDVNPAQLGLSIQFAFNRNLRWSYGPLLNLSYLKSNIEWEASQTKKTGVEVGVGLFARYMLARSDRLNLYLEPYSIFHFENTNWKIVKDDIVQSEQDDIQTYGTFNCAVGMTWIFNPKWSISGSFSPSGLIFAQDIKPFSNDFFVRALKYFLGVEYNFDFKGKAQKKSRKKKKR